MATRAEAGAPMGVRAVVAATVGNALEFYDFLTYAFFAIQIGHALFPAQSAYGSLMLSLATFGAGFVTRPIGGILIGAYSDRAGRRSAMMLSFTLMGGAIVAMALIPPYAMIGIAAPILAVLARMVMGFSLGGEVGPTTAYLLETAPVERRGFMVSWQGASQMIAAIAGGVVGLILSAAMSRIALESYGWRIAFLLGAITVPFGLWVRRGLPETLHDDEPRPAAISRATTRLGVARENSRIIILGLIVLAYGTISTYVMNYMTTFAQDTLKIAAGPAFAVTVVSNLTRLVGNLYGGGLSDRFGRRPIMIWPNWLALLLSYPVFLWVVESRSTVALLAGMGLLNLITGFPFGAFYAALAESLPKPIRGGAFATIYAISITVFGGSCQLVVRWLIHVTGNPMAPAWYLLIATAIGQIAIHLIPESAPARRKKGDIPIFPAKK
ncbi:MAG TPA: MFS transporter [Tepidisphaeraceae bacterium]|nr:MFS transporter [Tepidisphaeraceae bacterium]